MNKNALQYFLSKEDFADAHEPLYDGTGEPPSVETQKSEEGAVPSSSEAAPASTDATVEETVVEETNDEATDTETTETVETTEETQEEPLAHDSLKEVERDEKVVEKNVAALEEFRLIAPRAEIIGYTKLQRNNTQDSINRIRVKSGLKPANINISIESIDEAIALGKTQLTKLAKTKTILASRISNENHDSVVMPAEIDKGLPLASPIGNPVNPIDASGEIDISLATPEIEVETGSSEFGTSDSVTTLVEEMDAVRESQIAVEQYIGLVRSAEGGKISRQAAAFITEGIRHIEQRHGLRARKLGFESFDASPRAAMEQVSVEESSLGKKLMDLGAKLLKMLIELLDEAAARVDKFLSGAGKVQSQYEQVVKAWEKHKDATIDETVTLDEDQFKFYLTLGTDGTIVDHISTAERQALTAMQVLVKDYVYDKGIVPISAAFAKKQDLDKLADELKSIISSVEDQWSIKTNEEELPGGFIFKRDGVSVTIDSVELGSRVGNNSTYTVPQSAREIIKDLKDMKGYVDQLNDTQPFEYINRIKAQSTKMIKTLQRGIDPNDNDVQSAFQDIQNQLVQFVSRSVGDGRYLKVLQRLLLIQSVRNSAYAKMLSIYTKSEQKEAE